MEGQETLVRDALSAFLRKHSEEESISGIDEIVLSYMVSVLEELGTDLDAGDDAFDLDGFMEMMDAYLPGFSNVNSVEVCEWMFQLAAHLRKGPGNNTKSPATLTLPLMIPPPCDKAPTTQKHTPAPVKNSHYKDSGGKGQGHSRSGRRSRKSSDNNSTERCSGAEAGKTEVQNGYHDNGTGIDLLAEMFPTACSIELSHCLDVSHGDLEAAAQLILLRQEAGESFLAAPPKPHQSSAKKANLSAKEGTNMKRSIISKYSYVDIDESKKEHRPVMPKYEGKKLTRYLDNKVVSTKGEKFTEIKSAESEEKEKEKKEKKSGSASAKANKHNRFH